MAEQDQQFRAGEGSFEFVGASGFTVTAPPSTPVGWRILVGEPGERGVVMEYVQACDQSGQPLGGRWVAVYEETVPSA